jgi:hypothetical protein
MKRWLMAGFGAVSLMVAASAMARVDVGINVGVPGVIYGGPAYVAPPPVYYAPPPPVYYGPRYVAPPPVYVYGGPRYYHGPGRWDHRRGWDRGYRGRGWDHR